ncbi:RHS repeat-associated core domain-containing protein [Maricaulis maris]|uniref:RHS repeat-associated protein n=1 Tax=Maricaulis maris TaxID=74318 RepID=A0A495D284_9PROT|nr:RHS repeat-associated core domain-containing protein [Maricaulis maris]RKQ95648.1 RHS repeat-associated protein [Maricaulis maris]
MLTLNDFANSIDPATGNLAFSLPLAALPEGSGPEFALSAQYASALDGAAEQSNLTAPTGWLGLGWTLNLPSIVAVPEPDSLTRGRRLFLVRDGRMTELVPIEDEADGSVSYGTVAGDFWVIRYSAANESWTLIDEDGLRWRFGGTPSSIELGVAWEGWSGASSVTTGQSSQAVTWWLSRLTDLWQQTVDLTYTQTTETVGDGSAAYTRSTRLARVTRGDGARIDLSYQPKTTDEYVPAHQTPPAPNAWQDRYDSHFLASISVTAGGGGLLNRTEFSYALMGTGPLTKRLLTAVAYHPGGSPGMPATTFSYQVAAGADYGMMTGINTALGGTVEVEYAAVTPAFSDRSQSLSAPGGGPFGTPVLGFAADFVVAAWPATDSSSVALQASSWDGRWVPADLGTLATSTAAPDCAVKTAGLTFAAQTATQFKAWRTDPRMSGAWTASDTVTVALSTPASVDLSTIDDCAGILGSNTAVFQALIWNGSEWAERAAETLGGADSSPLCAMDGAGDALVAVVADTTNAGKGITVHRMGPGPFAAWQSSSDVLVRDSGTLSTVSVTAGCGFAVIIVAGPAGGRTRARAIIVDWLGSGGQFRSTSLTQFNVDTGGDIPEPVVNGSSIALGELIARYDGQQWTINSVEAIKPSGAQTLQLISCAADQIVRTYSTASGDLVASLTAYNPNTTTGAPWAIANSVTVPSGAYAARAAAGTVWANRYVLMPHTSQDGQTTGNAIYYQSPDMSWGFAGVLSDTLSASDLPSLQLAGERFLVYQSGSSVTAIPLADGTLDTANKSAISGKLLVSGAAANLLVGPTAFATYSGDWTSGPTISLHRVTRGGADGPASVMTVSRLRCLPGNTTDTTTGYAVIDRAPSYETASAVMAPSGRAAAFNRTTIASQSGSGTACGSVLYEMFNMLTAAEAASLPTAKRPDYPTETGADPSTVTRLLAGLTYRTTTSWLDDAQVAQSNTTDSVVKAVARQFLPAGGDYAPCGFFSRIVKTIVVTDGVTSVLSVQYNQNGFPAKVTGARFDGEGQTETLETDITYFPEVYTTDVPENLLSPVVQSISKSNGASVSGQATTWSSDWGTQATDWAVQRMFVAADKDFVPFDAWTTGATPTGWRLETETRQRNSLGSLVEEVDTIGRAVTNIYDRSERHLVARFGLSNPPEATYYGFEPYEATGPWSYQGASSITSHIVQTQYHTGSQSLEIAASPPASPQGAVATLRGLDADRRYIFSCWMLPAAGFTPDDTKARWTLQAYQDATSATPVGDPVVVGFPASPDGKWVYIEAVIDLPAIAAAAGLPADTVLGVGIDGFNAIDGGAAVYVDELRFCPLDAVYSAVVFDPSTWMITASLGENGATARIVRTENLQTVATIGPSDDNVGVISATAYARNLSGQADSYDPVLPNQVVRVSSSSFGGYQDFDPSDVADWTLASGWGIANRQLTFAGSSSDPIGSRAELKNFTSSNYAGRVQLSGVDPALTTVSIGSGDLFVSWVPGSPGKWQLRQSDGGGGWTTLAERGGAFGTGWLFAVVDGVAFFFVDGNQIFGDLLDFVPQGKLIIAATGAANFEQLVIARDPSIDVSFVDGAGTLLQTMAMVDRQTAQISGILFDEFGRPSVQREPVQQTVAIGDGAATPAIASRTEGALTTYLPDKAGGTQMTIAEYLDPAVSDAPFNRTRMEASPSARPLEIAGPGADHALGSGHTVRLGYGANAAGSWLDQVLTSGAPGRAAGSYYLNTVTDPNGNQLQTATNQSGQEIAKALIENGSTTPIRIESYLYDGAGNRTETRLPNYYDPPADADSNTVWKRTSIYDFLGNRTGETGPDSGTTRFMYDSVNRQRFSMDAAGAALSPQVIQYSKYDAQDRVIETGTVSKSGLTWADLAAHVDDPIWPEAADGALWLERYEYDRVAGPGAQPPNQVGRLIVSRCNRSASWTPGATEIDTESFVYDRAGNVITQTNSTPGFDDTIRQTEYAFDNLNRPIEIVFPRALSGTGQPQGNPVNATYFYDRLGRMASVGEGADGTEVLDPDNPVPGPEARYARMSYDARGLLSQTVLGMNSGGPIQQTGRYDIAGRPLTVGGDYVLQTLAYGNGGIGGPDEAERVATGTIAYMRHPGAPDDLASGLIGTPRTWQYGYDTAGNLCAAMASDAGEDTALNTGTATHPITYDANGTLLTVPRGPATETYHYADPVSGKRSQDRILSITTQVDQAVDLSSGTLPEGWTVSASNAGPSPVDIVTGAGGTVADYIQMVGGTASYHQTLRYSGAFGMAQSYRLAFQWKSAAGFAAAQGPALLQIVFRDAQGDVFRTTLTDLGAGADDWTAVNADFDLADLCRSLAIMPADVVSVSLEFINGKRQDDGSAGPALMVGALVLSTLTMSGSTLGYDAAGRLVSNPQRFLSAIQYRPGSGQMAEASFSAPAAVQSASYFYGSTGQLSTITVTPRSGDPRSTLLIRAPGGAVIARYDRTGSGPATGTFEIPGKAAGLARIDTDANGAARYYLRDNLGSVRGIGVEGSGNDAGLESYYDYGAYGELVSASSLDTEGGRYTGQRLDPASGLTQFALRGYDPALRAFLSPDPGQETPWPYAYVGNDPINRIDPDGAFMQFVMAERTRNWVGLALFVGGSINILWTVGQAVIEDPWGGVADATEWVIGRVVLPPIAVMATASWLLSPVLRNFANVVHRGNPHHRTCPVVSITMDIGAGMAGAGMLSAVRDISHGYVRRISEPLGVGEMGWRALGEAWNGLVPAIVGSLYQHLYSPRLNAFGVRGVLNGPRVHRMANGGHHEYFLRADGFYAFEEYIEEIGWIPSFLEQGNADMRRDTNLALAICRPFNYFELFGQPRMRYGNPAYKATNLVLEHRDVFGYVLFLSHAHHTPGRGGPRHVGVSAIIRHGHSVSYYLYVTTRDALLPAAVPNVFTPTNGTRALGP